MSLRDLIEAKARRTEVLPISVGDTSAAAAAVTIARAALETYEQQLAARRESGEEEVDAQAKQIEEHLQAELVDAVGRQAATVALVELQSLDDDVWDAIMDDIEDDGDGPDLSSVRAALVAASCVDEDLRDESWWAEQFARPAWSKGDLIAVNNTLLRLNLGTPSATAGKG